MMTHILCCAPTSERKSFYLLSLLMPLFCSQSPSLSLSLSLSLYIYIYIYIFISMTNTTTYIVWYNKQNNIKSQLIGSTLYCRSWIIYNCHVITPIKLCYKSPSNFYIGWIQYAYFYTSTSTSTFTLTNNSVTDIVQYNYISNCLKNTKQSCTRRNLWTALVLNPSWGRLKKGSLLKILYLPQKLDPHP